MIWGHSWEIEQYNLWDELEGLMQMDYIRNNTVKYQDMFSVAEDVKK